MMLPEVNEYFLCQWKANESKLAQIEQFSQLIFATVGKFNLTGHRTLEKIWKKLFVEGMMPYEQLKNFIANCRQAMDVGTGAGIPGILLKIFFPNLVIFLVESSQKKCEFLKDVIRKINLKKIILLNQRVENLAPQYFCYFDLITARALAPISTCLKWMEPYLKANGKIILPKSNHAQNEYQCCQKIMKKLQLDLTNIHEISNQSNLINYHTYVFQRKSTS